MDGAEAIEAFFDESTNTISENVKEPTSNVCAIFDSVTDLDFFAGNITHVSADNMVDRIKGGFAKAHTQRVTQLVMSKKFFRCF